MNQFLVRLIAKMNAVIAILLFLGVAFLVVEFSDSFLLGLLAGIVAAVLVGGLLAVAVQVPVLLAEIRDLS